MIYGHKNNERRRNGTYERTKEGTYVCNTANNRKECRVRNAHQRYGNVVDYSDNNGIDDLSFKESTKHSVSKFKFTNNRICVFFLENGVKEKGRFFCKYFASRQHEYGDNKTDNKVFDNVYRINDPQKQVIADLG